jgi:hypothetical protein
MTFNLGSNTYQYGGDSTIGFTLAYFFNFRDTKNTKYILAGGACREFRKLASMSFRVSESDILALGLEFSGYDAHRQARITRNKTKIAYFVSSYGHSPASFAPLFEDLTDSAAVRNLLGKPPVLAEFLMYVNWVKEGLTFNSLGGTFKVSPDTARKWCWKYADAVRELKASKVSCSFCRIAYPLTFL